MHTYYNYHVTGPVHFKTSDDIGVDSVIHFRAKLVAIISERGIIHIIGFHLSHVINISDSVILLSDKPGRDIFLYL